jgi:hypothetical protein
MILITFCASKIKKLNTGVLKKLAMTNFQIFFTYCLLLLFLHQIQEAGQVSGRRVYPSERHFESTRRKADPRGSQGGSCQLSGGGQGLLYFMRSGGQGLQLFLGS